MRIVTERLIIDDIVEADKKDYFNNISHDKKVLETFVCRYAEKLEDLDFSSYVGRKDIFAVRKKISGELIGIMVVCDRTETSCEIGYGFGSTHWGKGYATEAARAFIRYCFDEWKLRKIYASFFTGNEASRRVMEKCGMTYDRFSEKELNYLGKDRDLTYYSISVG